MLDRNGLVTAHQGSDEAREQRKRGGRDLVWLRIVRLIPLRVKLLRADAIMAMQRLWTELLTKHSQSVFPFHLSSPGQHF
jgi:hypothetical protein